MNGTTRTTGHAVPVGTLRIPAQDPALRATLTPARAAPTLEAAHEGFVAGGRALRSSNLVAQQAVAGTVAPQLRAAVARVEQLLEEASTAFDAETQHAGPDRMPAYHKVRDGIAALEAALDGCARVDPATRQKVHALVAEIGRAVLEQAAVGLDSANHRARSRTDAHGLHEATERAATYVLSGSKASVVDLAKVFQRVAKATTPEAAALRANMDSLRTLTVATLERGWELADLSSSAPLEARVERLSSSREDHDAASVEVILTEAAEAVAAGDGRYAHQLALLAQQATPTPLHALADTEDDKKRNRNLDERFSALCSKRGFTVAGATTLRARADALAKATYPAFVVQFARLRDVVSERNPMWLYREHQKAVDLAPSLQDGTAMRTLERLRDDARARVINDAERRMAPVFNALKFGTLMNISAPDLKKAQKAWEDLHELQMDEPNEALAERTAEYARVIQGGVDNGIVAFSSAAKVAAGLKSEDDLERRIKLLGDRAAAAQGAMRFVGREAEWEEAFGSPLDLLRQRAAEMAERPEEG